MRARACPLTAATLFLAAFLATGGHPALSRTAFERDFQDYAIAACMSAIGAQPLKDEADAWGGAILQRSNGDLAGFTAVGQAARRAALRLGPAIIRSESADGAQDRAVALLTCGDIFEDREVAAEIARLRTGEHPRMRR